MVRGARNVLFHTKEKQVVTLTRYEERILFQSFAQVLKGILGLMLPKEAGHVEVHMASHRFCLRLCFLGLVTLSLCSVVFIMTRGKNCSCFKISTQLIHLPSSRSWWVISALPRIEMIAY